MKLKKFDSFLNEEFNENLPYEYDYNFDNSKDEATDYPYNLTKAINRIFPLKSAKGHGDNYSTNFLYTLNNGKSFKYACFWDEDHTHDNANEEGVYEEFIVFNDKRTDILETENSIYGIGYDMATYDEKAYKSFFYEIGILEDFSAILNVEGYVLYVETFNTKEKAEEAAAGWKIEVVSGKHTQGKSLGNASIEDKD